MKAHKGYPHTFRVSTVRQLALRFSLLLAAIIALLSSGIILLLRMSIRNQQNRELTAAAETVAAALRNGQIREIDGELPYYITYAVYDSASKEITATNDPFLPALPVTPHRAERYTAKQYFSDGYLNILYYATAVSRMDAGNNAGAASGTDTTDSTNTAGSTDAAAANGMSSVSGTEAVDGTETATADGYVIQTALNMDTDTAEAILSGLPRMLALIGMPLLFISYGAAFFISGRTMWTVRAMTQAAQKIGASNLGERLPVTNKGDDFGELAKTFNGLLSRLQTNFERERQFTADVSHELKTPLAVILGHANLIRRWGKNDPNRLEQSLAAHVRSAGGAGLGLSIVKSIMHALGGSVHAESGDGKGAVIVMQLPRSKFDT